jgi:hypothetical protein
MAIMMERSTTRLLGLCLLMACSIPPNRPEPGQPPARGAEPEPPRCIDEGDVPPASIVQSLYRIYAPFGAPGLVNEPREVLLKYFDEVLTEMFLRDQACRRKSQGMCDLNSNVLVGGNYVEVTDLNLCVQRGSRTEVVARFLNGGRERVARFEVRKMGQDWKVTDINFAGEESLRAFALRPQ